MTRLGLIPDHGVEAMGDAEAVLLVEAACAVIAFGDGERKTSDSGRLKAKDAVIEQRRAETEAAQRGADAELRDVRGVLADARAEDHGEDVWRARVGGTRVAQYPGALGVEDAAAGEAHDVVEETLRAVNAAVLVVDAAVDVADVGEMDELGGGLIERGLPGFERDAGGQRVRGRRVRSARSATMKSRG